MMARGRRLARSDETGGGAELPILADRVSGTEASAVKGVSASRTEQVTRTFLWVDLHREQHGLVLALAQVAQRL